MKTLPALEPLAIVSVGELFGGVERHILGLLQGLRAHGIRAPLLLFCDGELADQARQQGFEVQVLPSANRLLSTTSRQLARYLSEHKVRVVHVHGYKATVYCAMARLWYRFAIVKTEHGLPERMAGRPIQQLRGGFYHWLDNMATRIGVTTICYVTKDLLAHYHASRSRLNAEVIPNGVASMDPHSMMRPPEFRPENFNVVIVGRLETVKGHRYALEAAASVDAPRNLHLHLIGSGPCESDLRALAEALSISERVHFLGFRRNIYDYIAHCDALLIPSDHEGLPYTLLEAMALGTPIVGSRVGGLAEVLEDEVTALLVPPGDIHALANGIRRLHENEGLRERLGKAAQCVQQSKFSLHAMTSTYLHVYRDLQPPHS